MDKNLVSEYKRKNNRANISHSILNEIQTKSPNKVVFSLEHLSRLLDTEDELRRLKDFLMAFTDEVKIVVF